MSGNPLATETEVKVGAWAGFELPPLDGIVDDVAAVARAPRTLMAVYYDTPDLRLAPWGVTVPHRTGDRWLDGEAPGGRQGPRLGPAGADVRGTAREHAGGSGVVDPGLRTGHAVGADTNVSVAVEELIAIQRPEADRGRQEWRNAWNKASDKKLRSWL